VPGTSVIAVSADDDTVRVSGHADRAIDEAAIALGAPHTPVPERTLILNWNSRLPSILTELDSYVAPGSLAKLVHSDPVRAAGIEVLRSDLTHLQVEVMHGDPTDRRLLDSLEVGEYDHVIVLGESETLDAQEADARTLTTLLHLRDIQERTGVDFSVVSEMVDLRNRQLAAVTRADDFIVSDQLVSLMLSQLSENPSLQPVFDDLFDPEGSEIYLKPVDQYVVIGRPINFYTVVEAARRRGEAAIGYRIDRDADLAERQYGIRVNPKKSQAVTYTCGDRIIVLAEN
jgi:ion channel POLLUX/CASTOR